MQGAYLPSRMVWAHCDMPARYGHCFLQIYGLATAGSNGGRTGKFDARQCFRIRAMSISESYLQRQGLFES